MSFDSQRTSSSAGERDLTVEIIRDPGFGGDWLNRYCQNAETHVLSNLRLWLIEIGSPLLLWCLWRLESRIPSWQQTWPCRRKVQTMLLKPRRNRHPRLWGPLSPPSPRWTHFTHILHRQRTQISLEYTEGTCRRSRNRSCPTIARQGHSKAQRRKVDHQTRSVY